MVNDIKGFGSSQTNDLRSRSSNSSEVAANRSTLANAAAPTPAKSSEDVVNISSQAASLKSLEGKMGKQPEVNQERVASIRKAIADGKYPVDAQKLAQKLLDMDSLLGD